MPPVEAPLFIPLSEYKTKPCFVLSVFFLHPNIIPEEFQCGIFPNQTAHHAIGILLHQRTIIQIGGNHNRAFSQLSVIDNAEQLRGGKHRCKFRPKVINNQQIRIQNFTVPIEGLFLLLVAKAHILQLLEKLPCREVKHRFPMLQNLLRNTVAQEGFPSAPP